MEGGADGVVVGVGERVDAEIGGTERGRMEDIIDADAQVVTDIGVAKGEGMSAAEKCIVEAARELAVGVRNGHVVEIATDDDRIRRGVDLCPHTCHLLGALGVARGEFGERGCS